MTLQMTLASQALAGKTVDSPDGEAINPNCLSGLVTELAQIERVTDGDTVVLTDQRRVRLIGINAAELNAPNKKLRQSAQAATDTLKSWLPPGEPVKMYLGTESHDRHGRLLAHVTRHSDNLAVAQRLVQKGLAAQSAVAPNIRCTEHFAELEATAQQAKAGIWAIRDLISVNAADLQSNKHLGFKLVFGTVTSVKIQKRFSEIVIDERLRLLVRPTLAKQMSLNALKGQRIEVRGWVSRRKNQVFLWLQHPANLTRLKN